LRNFGGIFIGGGNTYMLLKLVRESGFDKKLVKYLDDGGVVFGGSAGAIIMGKSIATCGDINNIGLSDLSGLDLLGGASVLCHYTNDDKEKAEAFSRELNSQIILVQFDSPKIEFS
jgi:dipeptidase E